MVGLVGALIEVSLFSFLGRLVDLAQTSPTEGFFSRHRNELLWMALVALVLRPVFFGLHDILVHQVINRAWPT
ncbi:hypothetical protein AWV80_27070 [Cupriavidus sp. UYMU48A]|nr:hypothetical protein AWV80_27070 [Cupriavidus sp. UYMU48A]